MKITANIRSNKGQMTAEYVAAITFFILALLFPLINLATVGYRYNMLSVAAKIGAHTGATANTFASGTSTAPDYAAMDAAPAAVNSTLASANGISNVTVAINVNQTSCTTPPVLTVLPTGQTPTKPASSNNGTSTNYVYAIQCSVSADVAPLAPISLGFIPAISGITSPMHMKASAQEVCENPNGLFVTTGGS